MRDLNSRQYEVNVPCHFKARLIWRLVTPFSIAEYARKCWAQSQFN